MLPLSTEENRTLEILKVAIEWHGRYPIPVFESQNVAFWDKQLHVARILGGHTDTSKLPKVLTNIYGKIVERIKEFPSAELYLQEGSA
jgi:hypothetical protein